MSSDADSHETPHKPDRPLHGDPHPHDKLHPHLYAAEFAGTALLVLLGLSIVIAMNGRGSPIPALLPEPGLRRAITGFLFGTVGGLIALSPLGRISGAHVNPAVSLAFWMEGKLAWRTALWYIAAQVAGGMLGAVPLLLWGGIGASIDYAATLPAANASAWWALGGEGFVTFALVMVIFVTAAHRATQALTPYTMAPLFCFLTWIEAPVSGASANPARSIAPATLAAIWQGQWIYVVGPTLGAAAAIVVLRLDLFGRHRVKVARVGHIGRDASSSPSPAGEIGGP